MMTEEELAQANKTFDERVQLFKENPRAFEQARIEEINNFIAGIEDPEKRERLEGLQWRVDQVRRKNKNPLSSTIAVSEMMWAGFRELNELWKEAKAIMEKEGSVLHKDEGKTAPTEEPKKADVLPFTPRKKETPTEPIIDPGSPRSPNTTEKKPIDPVLDPNRPRGPYAS